MAAVVRAPVGAARRTGRANMRGGRRRRDPRARAGEPSPEANREKFIGEWGARDPTAYEVESNFNEKSMGNADTEHVIKIPEAIDEVIGLTGKSCKAVPAGTPPLDDATCLILQKRVGLDWKLTTAADGNARLRREFTVKNFSAGIELFSRIAKVADADNHHPDLHLEGWNKASVELWTHTVSGLSENDFIVAAKINELDFEDLKKAQKKKQRFWA